MNKPFLTRQNAEKILKKTSDLQILVIGDLMLDLYLFGDVTRISPEAPVPIVHFKEKSSMPGGAANVARNLATLGVKTVLFGMVGKDAEGEQLLQILNAHAIDTSSIITYSKYRTCTKTRILASRQQLLRLDYEDPLSLTEELVASIKDSLYEALLEADAVIVADYAKGLINQEVLDFVKQNCSERKIPLLMDPKPAHQLQLDGITLTTPNRKEAFELVGEKDNNSPADDPCKDVALIETAKKLLKQLMPASLLITLGQHGMLLCTPGTQPIHIPTVAREVFDVSGAGDTVIATLTTAIAAGAKLVDAALLANHAAGIVVAKIGTATASQKEILDSLPE